MHPNAAFRWTDRDVMCAMVRDVAMGALFAATPEGPRVAHGRPAIAQLMRAVS